MKGLRVYWQPPDYNWYWTLKFISQYKIYHIAFDEEEIKVYYNI
jgi:hypothetical protein